MPVRNYKCMNEECGHVIEDVYFHTDRDIYEILPTECPKCLKTTGWAAEIPRVVNVRFKGDGFATKKATPDS